MQAVKIVFILLFHTVFAANEIKIVFLLESSQILMPESIVQSIQHAQKLTTDFILEPLVFEVDRNADGDFVKFCQLISKNGVSIIFDFTYYPWNMGLTFIRSLNIPYVPFGRILSPFMDMFADFMKAKKADDVAFILQNSQDMDSAFYQMIFGYPFKILLGNAEDEAFFKRLLELRPSPSYYAVFANTENMNKIFKKVTNGSLFSRPHEWNFIFLDSQHMNFKYEYDSEYVTKFTIKTNEVCGSIQQSSQYCQEDFSFEKTVLFSALSTLLENALYQSDWFKPQYVSCKQVSSDTGIKSTINLESFFRQNKFLKLITNNNNLFAEYDDLGPIISYHLNVSIDIYGSSVTRDYPLAKWQSGELKKINETISPAKRFFRIGVTEVIPWNYRKRNESGHVQYDEHGNIIWEGFCNDLINVLAEKLNFDFELVEPKSGKFGERDPVTKKWNGLVGDLVVGNTEFAVAALKMYAEREEVIDFIAPYFEQTGISIVIRKPVKETSLFKFMTVLRLEVWLSILASLVATAVMLWMLDKYSPYSARNNKAAYPYPCREFTLRESFWFALTSFTPQGGGETPKAVSGRILVAAYWLFVVLMLATFTANLAAFLTVERMQTPVQSLDQLGRQSRINYTVVAGSDTHQYFMNMKFAEDTLYRMWKELALNASLDSHKFRVWDYPIKEQYNTMLFSINETGPVKTAADGFRKVNEHENADFAFIHDSSEIKYEVTKNCNLTEVGEVFAEQPYAIAVQQGSLLSDEFSYVLLELQKDRYFEELKAKYWNTSKLRSCVGNEANEGITLESLGGVFIATFFGLLMAMVVLALEVIYYRGKPKPKKTEITKVKPAQRPKRKAAWQVDAPNLTPPPAFEALSFPKNKIPTATTFARPRRLGVSRTMLNQVYNENLKARDGDLPPYLE